MALSKSNRLLQTESGPAVQGDPGSPVRVALPSTTDPYVLATGEAATYRLRILHGLYGPGTRRVLLEAGLQRGDARRRPRLWRRPGDRLARRTGRSRGARDRRAVRHAREQVERAPLVGPQLTA